MVWAGAVATVSGCTFEANVSGHEAGGLLVVSSSAIVTDCEFLANQALEGGGVATTAGGPVEFHTCQFRSNFATAGGAANLLGKGTLFTGCLFEDNTSDAAGGAIVCDTIGTTIDACTFTGNGALRGGAIATTIGDVLNVSNSVFADNQSATVGGAIFVDRSAAWISSTAFAGNTSITGGAVHTFERTFAASATITDCQFTANSAAFGGALSNETITDVVVSDSTFQDDCRNCTIAGNPELTVMQDAILSIHNSVVRQTPLARGAIATVTIRYSNVELPGGRVFPGAGNINADPLFADPDGADDIPGTDDDDFTLLSSSPCVDAGHNMGDRRPCRHAPAMRCAGFRAQGRSCSSWAGGFRLPKTSLPKHRRLGRLGLASLGQRDGRGLPAERPPVVYALTVYNGELIAGAAEHPRRARDQGHPVPRGRRGAGRSSPSRSRPTIARDGRARRGPRVGPAPLAALAAHRHTGECATEPRAGLREHGPPPARRRPARSCAGGGIESSLDRTRSSSRALAAKPPGCIEAPVVFDHGRQPAKREELSVGRAEVELVIDAETTW